VFLCLPVKYLEQEPIMTNPSWYMNAVFYEVFVRAFHDSDGDGHGDLRGLIEKLDYLQALGVDCLWLLPIYQSPFRDGGYDISDYRQVLPEFGNRQDLIDLLQAAHWRGLRVVADLVLNHTSDQHPWFQSARTSKKSSFRDYYVWSDTDQKYQDARIIFIDTESSNWTWDEKAEQYFWHRFYAFQPDLNFDNPRVRQEMLEVARFWLDLGVDGFRVDAVPYLIEREGTNCENLPETHAYLKELRRMIDLYYPGRVLLCEANQWPEDVRAYFGEGDEFHMGFHFPLMPRLFMGLRQGLVEPIAWALERTPPIPPGCQWCTFLRNHDELTLEMVTIEERDWMWKEYAPESRMHLNLGIRRRLAPLLDNDRRKIELAYSLLFTLPGSPIIYYGDEIGMGDNIWLDDRDGVRTPMQWDSSPTAGFSTADPSRLFAPVISTPPFDPAQVNVADQLADPDSLLNKLRRMIQLRKKNPAFGWGDFRWVDWADVPAARRVAAYWRRDNSQNLLILNNLSDDQQHLEIPLAGIASAKPAVLLGSLGDLETHGGILNGNLQPYQYLWLQFPG
jgi:maltose alpha-D-glucosyltransferase / alpha-amylase